MEGVEVKNQKSPYKSIAKVMVSTSTPSTHWLIEEDDALPLVAVTALDVFESLAGQLLAERFV